MWHSFAMITLIYDLFKENFKTGRWGVSIVKSSDEEQHVEYLAKMFERLRKYKLRLNPNKCNSTAMFWEIFMTISIRNKLLFIHIWDVCEMWRSIEFTLINYLWEIFMPGKRGVTTIVEMYLILSCDFYVGIYSCMIAWWFIRRHDDYFLFIYCKCMIYCLNRNRALHSHPIGGYGCVGLRCQLSVSTTNCSRLW